MTKPWIRRKRNAIPLAFLIAGIVVAIVAYVSPWPSALLVRGVFRALGDRTTAEMQKHVPPAGSVDATLGVQYAPGGVDTQLDLFSPAGSAVPLPLVVWIHGGAWIEGDKESRDPYAQIIAAKGYTVASLNYTVGPDAIYPTAIRQLNDALGFLADNAARYRVDPARIVIAGDSAGAQLASQLATMITNPAYATLVGIRPALSPDQVRGVILDCGVYDVSSIPNAPGIEGWGFRTALWAYLGSKDWAHTAGGDQMSTIDDVTAAFPAAWISGGNADALTAGQSKPLAAKLSGLGVPVTELFYPDGHTPALGHEYQFHLDQKDAQHALRSTIAWLGTVTADQTGR
ncbi:MAG: alpha/beta hydrolase [Actinomycetota bacterium]